MCGFLLLEMSGIFWAQSCPLLLHMLFIYSFIGVAPLPSIYKRGRGPIFLDDVNCLGTETKVLSCTNSGIGVHNCVHSEDVGIKCEGDCYQQGAWENSYLQENCKRFPN